MKTRLLIITTIVFLISLSPVAAQQESTITLLHLTDYHSHAVPFYSEGAHDSAGVAGDDVAAPYYLPIIGAWLIAWGLLTRRRTRVAK